ncbi:MAG: hypothetical protein ACLFRT_02415 [Actinomycetota bacterium]
MGYSGRQVDQWFDHVKKQFQADSMWKGLLVWVVVLIVILALSF